MLVVEMMSLGCIIDVALIGYVDELYMREERRRGNKNGFLNRIFE